MAKNYCFRFVVTNFYSDFGDYEQLSLIKNRLSKGLLQSNFSLSTAAKQEHFHISDGGAQWPNQPKI